MAIAYLCPRCSGRLRRLRAGRGFVWECPECDGRGASLAVLRKRTAPDVLRELWSSARTAPRTGASCPVCARASARVVVPDGPQAHELDVCPACAFVWFDKGEIETLPVRVEEKEHAAGEELSPAARAAMAAVEGRSVKERWQAMEDAEATPMAWQAVLACLGLPVEDEVPERESRPFVTWVILGLMALATVLAMPRLRGAVEAFGLIPARPWRLGGLTFVTSFFLHAGLLHLLVNAYFLGVFGDNVEDALGKARFVALIALSALVGDVLHIAGAPQRLIPAVGASGGIFGVVTYYCLRFPRARLLWLWSFYWIPLRWWRVPAGLLLVFWFGLQVRGAATDHFSGVSYLGHLGGIATGALFWLLVC